MWNFLLRRIARSTAPLSGIEKIASSADKAHITIGTSVDVTSHDRSRILVLLLLVLLLLLLWLVLVVVVVVVVVVIAAAVAAANVFFVVNVEYSKTA